MKLNKIEPLYATLSILTEKEMPFSLSYKFTKILDKIETDYQYFVKKMREIINKYADKDENGELIIKDNNIQIKKDFISLAEKELNELNDIEVTIPDISFSVEELMLGFFWGVIPLTVYEISCIFPSMSIFSIEITVPFSYILKPSSIS